MAEGMTSNMRFGGYHHTKALPSDEEITQVGPGTPCGEYLRRFWHPVALSKEVGELPRRIRIFGEDLVLFRDRSERLGLLHLHCAHRGVSLEFGIPEVRGIRCCYHGWQFDVDGTVIEAPAELPNNKIQGQVMQGAYPVNEYHGMIFAYLGPPDEQPEFPIFDSYVTPGNVAVPYTFTLPCNWLQIVDNIVDPVHSSFLHTRISNTQFHDTWGEIPVLEFEDRRTGIYMTGTRRVGDNVWVRAHELIMPNIAQSGADRTMDGRTVKYFGRNSYTWWAVAIDDTNTKLLAWRNYNDRADPPKEEWMTEKALEVGEFGEQFGRPYEERQRRPGDYEVFIGQGPITNHRREHLASSDKGVAMLRRRLRRDIRALGKGVQPVRPSGNGIDGPIPTYGSDTVLKIPVAADRDDRAFCLDVAQQITAIYASADHLRGEVRHHWIAEQVQKLEQQEARHHRPGGK